MNDDILLTREQVGNALEYSNPDDSLYRIHKRHADRLDELSVIVKLSSTDGKMYNTTLYNERGIMEICRWSRQPKANQFMDWCWDIVEKYRRGNLNQDNSKLIQSITDLTTKVIQLVDKQNQNEIQKKKYFSNWSSKMFPKYDILMQYFNISRKVLYRNLFIEFQNEYPNIDLNQLQDDYCLMKGLNNCFTLDAIEFNYQVRDAFELMVNSLLDKYNLLNEENQLIRQSTIFDNKDLAN